MAKIIARRGSDEDDNENGQEKEIELRSREDRWKLKKMMIMIRNTGREGK